MYKFVRFSQPLVNYSPSEELVLLVNRANERIGETTRKLMRAQKLTHRSTYILIQNSKNQFYVQMRTLTKDIYPGYYDVATGGVILSSDPSDEFSARRELEEEMGIRPDSLEFCFDHYFENESSSVWGSVWLTKWEGELVLQPEEVQWVELMDYDEIIRRSQTELFTHDGTEILMRFVESRRLENA